MKVLHILNELRPSGAETMLASAAPFWQARGIELEVLGTDTDLGDYGNVLVRRGYRIHHIPFTKSLSFAKLYYNLLRFNAYDVVHIHTERANFMYALVAYMTNVPQIVRTVHSVFQMDGWLRLSRIAQRAALRRLGVIQVSIGPTVRATEWERFRNPTEVIPNWFDSAHIKLPTADQRQLARARLGLQSDHIVVISVGNCSSLKNHSALINALSMIRQERVVYLHIGQEEAGCTERSLVNDLGLAERTRFLGYQEDVSGYLAASDVYVMPSWYEGFGIAAIEALASGVPAVLADVPGLRDLRAYNMPVFWVRPEAESIAQGLRSVLSLPLNERIAIGHRARATAVQHFSIDDGANAYLSIYRDVSNIRFGHRSKKRVPRHVL